MKASLNKISLIVFFMVSTIDNGGSLKESEISKIRQAQVIESILDVPRFPNDSTKPSFITVTILVTIVSILSNALIIHVVRVNLHMRNTTNYFIVNMACGDLLATVLSCSTSIKQQLSGSRWISDLYGQVTCKLVYYVISVAMLCSIFSLVAVTFDRFLAVRRPVKYQHHSSWTKVVIPAIWMVALAIPSKLNLGGLEVRNDVTLSNRSFCVALYARSDGTFVTCVGYIIPHVVMVILYTMIAHKLWTRKVPGDNQPSNVHQNAHKTAKRVTYMIFCSFVTFNVCWLPIFIAFYNFYFLDPALMAMHSNPYVPPIVTIAVIANGPLNALIFAVFSENFRLAFKKALKIERLVILGNRNGNSRFGQRNGRVDPSRVDNQTSLEMTTIRVLSI